MVFGDEYKISIKMVSVEGNKATALMNEFLNKRWTKVASTG